MSLRHGCFNPPTRQSEAYSTIPIETGQGSWKLSQKLILLCAEPQRSLERSKPPTAVAGTIPRGQSGMRIVSRNDAFDGRRLVYAMVHITQSDGPEGFLLLSLLSRPPRTWSHHQRTIARNGRRPGRVGKQPRRARKLFL